uniref:glutamine--fructose-6-phosphate transaminase (isomerizing) n=1 Tax=Alcanivorax sp. TaxID=1872427 RepID=UPI002590E4D4
PEERNAHPHVCNGRVAVVHNGIIENYQALKARQEEAGYRFTSDTDSEVIAHAIDAALKKYAGDLLKAVQESVSQLEGAYAIGVVATDQPDVLVAARQGSPLVIGLADEGAYLASDVSALLPVTQKFMFLEDGDVALLRREGVTVYDRDGQEADRPVKVSSLSAASVELGSHEHYMHKEIHEQPQAVSDTLEGRVTQTQVLVQAFGHEAEEIFGRIDRVQIVACGTSYHAGLVARYWFEDIIGLPCCVEVASEYRYRNPVLLDRTLFVTISQSGETADTLAALKMAREKAELAGLDVPTLTICNVAESSLTRESDMTFLTHAGPEIGVASTKAFTTQLVALALLMTAIGRVQQRLSVEREQCIVQGLHRLPGLIKSVLSHEEAIAAIARELAGKHNMLFLGRGTHYPIAMEGALKLKEISYIHAEAYPAGELKHGPLALIDENMPVIAVAPNDELLEKLKSNLQEVAARGGRMIVFEDEDAALDETDQNVEVIKVAKNVGRITAPIVLNIPLQIFSYHVGICRGTDIDRPRNLAKSVTVE